MALNSRMTMALAVTAGLMTSGPALAAAVGATPPATATAKIVKPLTLTKNTNLDFGTIVMQNVTQNNAVSLDTSNNLSCGFVAELLCSGTTTPANFTVKGTNNVVVKIYTAASTLNGSNGGSLTFTPAAQASINLGASGLATGVPFNVGGSIVVGAATVDGIYTGNMDVTVDYN